MTSLDYYHVAIAYYEGWKWVRDGDRLSADEWKKRTEEAVSEVGRWNAAKWARSLDCIAYHKRRKS
jgi:hypothetical protein